jgi:hypothetical protein
MANAGNMERSSVLEFKKIAKKHAEDPDLKVMTWEGGDYVDDINPARAITEEEFVKDMPRRRKEQVNAHRVPIDSQEEGIALALANAKVHRERAEKAEGAAAEQYAKEETTTSNEAKKMLNELEKL